MKNPNAQALGSLGGKARDKKYSKEQKSAWAKKGGRPRTKPVDNVTKDTNPVQE